MGALTKLAGPKRVHEIRTMGGNRKFRALRLETGNFSWGSEGVSRKTRLIDVVYNASNNELVRTKTLVKNAIIVVDATPFKQWYETHYGLPIGKKKGGRNQSEVDEAILNKPRSNHLKRKLEEQFALVVCTPACRPAPARAVAATATSWRARS